jgi:hypothetical protein
MQHTSVYIPRAAYKRLREIAFAAFVVMTTGVLRLRAIAFYGPSVFRYDRSGSCPAHDDHRWRRFAAFGLGRVGIEQPRPSESVF